MKRCFRLRKNLGSSETRTCNPAIHSRKCCKTPKYSDTRKIALINLKFGQCGSIIDSNASKRCKHNGKRVEPDQTAPLGYIVCPNLSVRKLGIITVLLVDTSIIQ